MKINVAAWGLGTVLLSAAWIAYEWQANGAFERFAHEGNPGDWPTLWALAVLVWALAVGIMALRVYFERPAIAAEVDREAARLRPHSRTENVLADVELRRPARMHVQRRRRLRFDVSAWLFAMIMLTPLNLLLEWQDNGGFRRISRNSQPGSWDPWILFIGGILGSRHRRLLRTAGVPRPAENGGRGGGESDVTRLSSERLTRHGRSAPSALWIHCP